MKAKDFGKLRKSDLPALRAMIRNTKKQEFRWLFSDVKSRFYLLENTVFFRAVERRLNGRKTEQE